MNSEKELKDALKSLRDVKSFVYYLTQDDFKRIYELKFPHSYHKPEFFDKPEDCLKNLSKLNDILNEKSEKVNTSSTSTLTIKDNIEYKEIESIREKYDTLESQYNNLKDLLQNLTTICNQLQEKVEILAQQKEEPINVQVHIQASKGIQVSAGESAVTEETKQVQTIPAIETDRNESLQEPEQVSMLEDRKPVDNSKHIPLQQCRPETIAQPKVEQQLKPPVKEIPMSDECKKLIEKYNTDNFYRTSNKFKLSSEVARERANDLKGFESMEVSKSIPFEITTGEGIYFCVPNSNMANQYYALPLRNWTLDHKWLQNNAIEDIFDFEGGLLGHSQYKLVKPAIFEKAKDKEKEYHVIERGIVKTL